MLSRKPIRLRGSIGAMSHDGPRCCNRGMRKSQSLKFDTPPGSTLRNEPRRVRDTAAGYSFRHLQCLAADGAVPPHRQDQGSR